MNDNICVKIKQKRFPIRIAWKNCSEEKPEHYRVMLYGTDGILMTEEIHGGERASFSLLPPGRYIAVVTGIRNNRIVAQGFSGEINVKMQDEEIIEKVDTETLETRLRCRFKSAVIRLQKNGVPVISWNYSGRADGFEICSPDSPYPAAAVPDGEAEKLKLTDVAYQSGFYIRAYLSTPWGRIVTAKAVIRAHL